MRDSLLDNVERGIVEITQEDQERAERLLREQAVERARLAKLSNKELFSEILNDLEFDDDLRVLALMDRLVPGWYRE